MPPPTWSTNYPSTVACLLRFPSVVPAVPILCSHFLPVKEGGLHISILHGLSAILYVQDIHCFIRVSDNMSKPHLNRGTTFLCDRRVRTLSCAMERVPKSRCAMRSARTYRGPHFCKAFRPLLSVYSIRGFEREPLLQRF